MPKPTLNEITNQIQIPKDFKLKINYVDLNFKHTKSNLEFFVFEDLFNDNLLSISDDGHTWLNFKGVKNEDLPKLLKPLQWAEIQQLLYYQGIHFLSSNEFTVDTNLASINAEVQNFAQSLIQINQLLNQPS